MSGKNQLSIAQIKKIAASGESDTLEFKKSTAQLHAAFETICAFLNGNGGIVLIGVNNKGELIGQDVTDNTRQEIARELSKIKPHPEIGILYIPVEGNRQIIAITTKNERSAPYIYDDRPFLRNQSSTIRMPQEKYERLLYSRKPDAISWEGLTTNDCTLEDLDKNRIQQVVRVAVSERRLPENAIHADMKEILKKLNLIKNEHLTNAAVILFCKNEQKQFMQSQLKLARFKGINKSEFMDNKMIRGNAFDLYEHGMNFLQNYLPVAGKIEEGNPFRVDTPAIPYKVLREALVNALCHRDYSLPGGSVSLAIYDDRVEISSSGRLPSDISLTDLIRQHESHPRNPLIANTFYAYRLIELWGRGTQDMIELCQEFGNPVPKYIELTGSFSVILSLKQPIGASLKSSTKKIELSKRQQDIFALIQKKGAMNIQGIERELVNPPTQRMIRKDLDHLRKENLIALEGHTKNALWVLKQKS